ncbi:cytochrome c family protein [Hyphomonas neptunium ATCC 15444]|uniref:Cytochrome c family protein n=2 Tax=Hyphomonas TaxID=85 RepID=Q0C4F6_HYPNA|nr:MULTISPECIES: c-type cytochrome [Hyphomonas]ABI76270.1 cytochrome c family protein [Hyphomonas neptunium ATCC 15444]KCZ96401.1 cytochrome c family protein [Hyphomonas hirschiana VP5]
MGELGLNKIIGAVLASALGIMFLMQLPNVVFASGAGHHGEEAEATTLSEKMCQQFHYCVEVAEAAGAGADAAEEVFDLGAALASADLTRGERLFASQCSTCHTINAGGANGTGPNLHNTVGADKAHIAGFAYSGALSNAEGSWTYENLNEWINNPSAYVRGTSMSFAGIRRDTDRAAVIAYLAANTENAPAFPEPLPAAEEAGDEAVPAEGEAVEGEAAPADGAAVPAEGEAAPAAAEEGAAPAEEAPATEEAPTEAPAEEAPAE